LLVRHYDIFAPYLSANGWILTKTAFAKKNTTITIIPGYCKKVEAYKKYGLRIREVAKRQERFSGDSSLNPFFICA